jgi:DNA-binding XRE family transcriptional regulator
MVGGTSMTLKMTVKKKKPKYKKSDWVTLDQVMQRFTPERRAYIEKRAKEMIAENLTLRDLRKACGLTQVKLSKKLGVGQDRISRMEAGADMMLSTLGNYVKAMGGELHLTVAFKGRPTVTLTDLTEL